VLILSVWQQEGQLACRSQLQLSYRNPRLAKGSAFGNLQAKSSGSGSATAADDD